MGPDQLADAMFMVLQFHGRLCLRARAHVCARRGRGLLLAAIVVLVALVGAQRAAAAPVNDNFASALTVTTGTTQAGDNTGATMEAGEAAATGSSCSGGNASVWYKWTPAVSGYYLVDTLDSGWDTTVGVYTGASASSVVGLTFWGLNDDNGTQGLSDGVGGTATNPFFGEAQTMVYATGSTLYHIRVADCATDGLLGDGPDPFELNVSHSTINDVFANAAVLNDSANGTGTNSGWALTDTLGATKEVGEPNHAGNAGGASVWFSWTAPSNGTVTFNTTGAFTSFDTLLAAYTGAAVGSLTSVASNDNASGSTTASSISFAVTSGTKYMIAIDGHGGATGIAMLRYSYVAGPPANDNFASASVVAGAHVSTTGSTTMATTETNEPLVGDPAAGGTSRDDSSIWYKWTAPATAWFSTDTFGSGYETLLNVYTGASLTTLVGVASNYAASCGSNGEDGTGFSATNGTTYYFRIATEAFWTADTAPEALTFHIDQGPPANDNFSSATALVGTFPTSGCANNFGATEEAGEPGLPSNQTSVWYTWTAPSTGSAEYTLPWTDIPNGEAKLYTGAAVGSLAAVGTTTHGSNLWFNATNGTVYRFKVDSTTASAMGHFKLQVNPDPAPPATVYDGPYLAERPWNTSAATLQGSWTPNATDPVSSYGWCFTTTPGPTACQSLPLTSGTATPSTNINLTATGLALTEGTTYYFCVSTNTAYSTGDTDTCSSGQTEDDVAPSTVTTLSAPSPTITSPALTWTTVTDDRSGVAYYRVMRSMSATGPWLQMSVDGAVTTGSFTDVSATTGTWYYEVQAVDNAGNVGVLGNVATVVVNEPTPGNLFTNDTNAQLAPNCGASACVEPSIYTSTPHFSWTNLSSSTVNLYRAQAMTDPLDSAVTGLWHLDGGVADAGSGNNPMVLGTSPATPSYTTSINSAFGSALSFDGVNDKASIPANPLYDRSSNFTLELWFRTSSLPNAFEDLVAKGPFCANPNASCNFGLLFDRAGNSLSVTGSSGGVEHSGGPGATSFIDGHWHYAAIVADGSNNLLLYLDGRLRATVAMGGPIDDAPGYQINVGSNGGGGNFFGGQIDDVRYSSTARSAADIEATFDSRQPHARLLWDSDPTNTGTALASCTSGSRCADVPYGSGQAGAALTGGRTYVRSEYWMTPGNAWTSWGGWDWFAQLTGRPVNLYSDDTNAATGVANKSTIQGQTPHFSWINTSGQTENTQRAKVYNDTPSNVAALWHFDSSGTDSGPSGARTATLSGTATYSAGNTGFSQALSTDGTTGVATVANDSSLDLANNFTVDAWIKPTSIANVAFPTLLQKSSVATCGNATQCNYSFEFERGTSDFCAELTSSNVEYDACTPPNSASTLIDGRWHYIAMTVDSSNTLCLYVDGVLQGTTALPGPVDTTVQPLTIGNSSNGTLGYDGLIDDVRISSTARSAAEIAGYYATGLPHETLMWDSSPAAIGNAISNCSDNARCQDSIYGTNGGQLPLQTHGARYYVEGELKKSGDPSWTDWSDWDWFATSPVPAPSGLYIDNTNASAGSTEPPGITSVTPHFSLTNNASTSVTAQRTQVLSDVVDANVAGLWHFDTATGNTVDASQFGNSLTAVGAPTYSAGMSGFGQALTLNGTSQYASAPTSTAYDLTSGFETDAWFAPPSGTTAHDQTILERGAAGGYDYSLSIPSGSTHVVARVTVGGTDKSITSTASVTNGAWHYAALVVDGSNNLSLYVDGVLSAGPLALGGPVSGGVGQPISIGRYGTSSGGWFSGQIDDVRILRRAPSPAEIAGYYATQQPHGAVLWDSSPTDAGAALTSCATTVRCTDITYAGSPALIHDGARYWVTAKYQTGGIWSDWSTPDWFGTQTTISLSVDSGTVSLGTVLPVSDQTATSTLTVATNAANGYGVTATDGSDTWALDSGAAQIPDYAAACTAPSVWNAGVSGGFGVTVLGATGGATARLAKWGIGTGTAPTDFTHNSWCGLQQSTAALLHQRTGYYAGNDTIAVAYRLNALATQPSGSYAGTISYTATVNP